MPRMKLGKFEDSAIERWYLLWRAECVPGFYKEISNINLLICGLQCIFEVLKGFAVECFGLAVSHFHIAYTAGFVMCYLCGLATCSELTR